MESSFKHLGKQHAVLLVHGLDSTPREMRYVAKALVNEDYSVSVPVIPGYTMGTEPRSWSDWLDALRAEYRALAAVHETVSVGGICIGATLALALAAEEPDITALALYAVTLSWDGWSIPWYHFLLSLAYHTPLRRLYSFKEREPFGLKNEALRARIAKAMRENAGSDVGAAAITVPHIYQARRLARHVGSRLPRVVADTLLIHAIDDETSSPRNASVVHDRIGATVKRKILLDDSYHIITMDNEREAVARETLAFLAESIRRRGGATGPQQTHVLSKALRRAQRAAARTA
jgi:carboxylesterase